MLKSLLNKKEKEDREITLLKEELERCIFLMERNDTFFNMSTDEDLIESQIYESRALKYQYNYLLKQLKEKEKAVAKQEIKIGE